VGKLWFVICASVRGIPVHLHSVRTKIRFKPWQTRLEAEGSNRRLIHFAISGSFLPTTTMSTAESSSGGRNTQRPPQKQMPCRFWKQGDCTDGNKCKFSHDATTDNDQSGSSMPTLTNENIPDPRLEICRYWNVGRCDYGEMCNFRHSYDVSMKSNLLFKRLIPHRSSTFSYRADLKARRLRQARVEITRSSRYLLRRNGLNSPRSRETNKKSSGKVFGRRNSSAWK